MFSFHTCRNLCRFRFIGRFAVSTDFFADRSSGSPKIGQWYRRSIVNRNLVIGVRFYGSSSDEQEVNNKHEQIAPRTMVPDIDANGVNSIVFCPCNFRCESWLNWNSLSFSLLGVLQKCCHYYHPFCWDHDGQGVSRGGGSTFFYAVKRAAATTFLRFFSDARCFPAVFFSVLVSGAGDAYGLPCSSWKRQLIS